VATQRAKAAALIERFGGGREGAFAPSGLPIESIAGRVGTPFYLYDGGLVEARARAVVDALGTELLYSVKANPSLAVSQILAGVPGVGAEVASAGELAVVLAAGFAASSVLFAGPGKTDDELDALVAAGILADNVESLAEIDRLAAAAARAGATAGVGLRLNPATQLKGAQMRMGGTASQFGIGEEELEAAVERLAGQPGLELRGIHVYTATQVFDAAALVEHCRSVVELAVRTAELAGQPLEFIDFGGGFGIPYFEGLDDFDLGEFGTGFGELRRPMAGEPRLADTRLFFELGRYLVADAGIYVTRVVDAKDTRGTSFVITDGGMNHHLTATGNMGQVFRKAFPLANLSRLEGATRAVTVTGPLCTPLDVFGSGLELVAPRVGDLVGVLYSGAYGYSASNLGFLSHPAPAEVLLLDGELHVLRARGRDDDVLAGQAGIRRPVLPSTGPAGGPSRAAGRAGRAGPPGS
jgi:diaminopimelate decarboxylase